jgi:hypothetical protein
MLDHMRLYTAKGEMLYIYIYIYACGYTAKDARPHAVIPQKMHGDAYIYIYIMTACGYTAKDGPLNVCDI